MFIPLVLLPILVSGRCYGPEPEFPLPILSADSPQLSKVLNSIDRSLHNLVSKNAADYNATSFSVEITSSQSSLWSYHHTASVRNSSRPGAPKIDDDSVYRIASISKVFTTLGVLYQEKAGNLSLDAPVKTYIAELADPQNGTLPWHDITLRSLASQLSGIPREFCQSDLANELDDPSIVGLPRVPDYQGMTCDEDVGYRRSCDRKDMLDKIKTQRPVFAPNQKSTYSNVAFSLLGLALSNATGLSYADYMQAAIFGPLGMRRTSLRQPADAHAALPASPHLWDVDMGVQEPTGGIYSSASDLSRFLRHVLSRYNGLTPALNWLQPASYASGARSFFGTPWEIFRTDAILQPGPRPVTFVTKSGGYPGYTSIIILVPQHDVGITILVAGNGKALAAIRRLVTLPLARAIDDLVAEQVDRRYSGTYVSSDATLNSSLTLTTSRAHGVTLSGFTSNGTNVLASPLPSFAEPGVAADGSSWHVQLLPTLLYVDEGARAGERWRMLVVPERKRDVGSRADADPEDPWDEHCITDVDRASYAGEPLNELVFWSDGDGDGAGKVVEVELPAFRVSLRRQVSMEEDHEESGPLLVQDRA